jgi:hypothetical protein
MQNDPIRAAGEAMPIVIGFVLPRSDRPEPET